MTASNPTPDRPTAASFPRRVLGLLLYLLATVAFAETACRLGSLGPDAAEIPVTVPDGPYGVHDDELGWTACPHSRILGTTELGLRGHLPAVARGERTFRIACVGDEATWGELVDPEDVWSRRAAARLRGDLEGAVVESINVSGIGYSSHQDVLLFERVAAPRAPDATVLFLTTRNDRTDGAGVGDAEWWATRERLRDSVLGWSRLARTVSRAWHDGWKAPYRRSDRPRVAPGELMRNIERLDAATRAGGGVVIAILPPLPPDDPWAAAQRDVCARIGIPTVAAPPLDDARGTWNTEGGAPKLTRAGHATMGRLAARAILEAASEKASELRQRSPGGAALGAIAPRRVTFARSPTLELEGEGLGDVRRLFVDAAEITEFDVRDDGSISFTVPRWLAVRPGRRPVIAVTDAGRAEGDLVLVTARPRITWKATPSAKESGVFSAYAPAYSKIVIWFSTSLLDRPVETPFGEFALAGGMKPAEAFDRDVWTRLPLLALTGHADRGGRFRVTVPSPPPGSPPPPKKGYVQALVIWGPRPDDACLSEVTEVVSE